MERALAKLLSRRRSASGTDSLLPHPKLSSSSRSRSMTGPVAEEQEAFVLRYLGYSYIDDPRSTKEIQQSITAIRESSAAEKVVQLRFHKGSLVVMEESEKLLLSPLHFVHHCAQDIKGSSCFGIAFGAGHYMKQCHVFQAKSDREATDLVQILHKFSKLSKSKKPQRPQEAMQRSVNSPIQKKFHLPMRVGIFEEEEHNPLETKSLSSLSHRESRAASLGPSSSTTTSSQTSSLYSMGMSEHAPVLRLSSRLAPTPPQTKRTFFPSAAVRTVKRSDEFTRKEKMEQLCTAVDKVLENNNHLRLLSSKSHPAGSFQDVIHAIYEGNSKLVESYISSTRTVVDACDGDQNSLLHYATAVGSVDIVNLLCNKGANVDAAGWNECRPIHRAAAEGNIAILQALLARGAVVNSTDLMRRTPLHMSAGNPKHLESSWVLLENGGQVTACDVLGVRPLDLYPELEKMQARRIASICEIFTATTLPNPRPISTSSTQSSPSFNSRPSSQLAENLQRVGRGHFEVDPLLLQDLFNDVDQVRIQTRRMLYNHGLQHKRPLSHLVKRHRSFSNLEELKEDEEDEMAKDQLLKYPSAFDLQSYYLNKVQSDAVVTKSKLDDLMNAINRLSTANRSTVVEAEPWSEGAELTEQKRKRSFSEPNICDAVGEETNRNTVVTLTVSPPHSRPASTDAILEPSFGNRDRPESVGSRISMATLTESSRKMEEVEKRKQLNSQSFDSEGGSNDVVESLNLLVKDFNRLSLTLDETLMFPLDSAEANGLKDTDRTLPNAAEVKANKEMNQAHLLLHVDEPGSVHVPRLRPKSQEETTAIFDSLIAQINEARDSVSPPSPAPKEGKTPMGGLADSHRNVPPIRDNPTVEVIHPSPPAQRKKNKRQPSPLKIVKSETTPPPLASALPATAVPVVSTTTAERRRKHSLPTLRMLGNSTDSATSNQMSTSSSSNSLDTSFLCRLSSISGGSHDDPEATLALRTLVKMSHNKECLATIVSYVCLPKFCSKLLSIAQSHHTSPEVLTSVATLVQNIYEVGGTEGKKLALGSGMLDLTVKLLDTRDPIPGTCLSILNSLLVSDDDNEYLKTIIRIPTQPLLTYLEPCESDVDSGVDNSRVRSSSDTACQQLLATSSADSSRPNSMSSGTTGPYLEVIKRRGLSLNSEASDSSSSRSLVSPNLHGQPVTYFQARHIVLKMLAIASNHSKMQHDLSTDRTISLLMGCLGDPSEENVTNGMICLANLAQNVECHHLLVQAKLAEKLGNMVLDSQKLRFHATRALVYLGHLDLVKMSLFEPNSFDVDNIVWSDESSSTRYARGASLEKLVELLTGNISELWGGFHLRPSSPPYQGDPSKPSPEQIMDFFMATYQSFVHPLILLRLLIHRLHSFDLGAPFNWATRYEKPSPQGTISPSPSSSSSTDPSSSYTISPIQSKVMNFLVRWLENSSGDFKENAQLQEQLGMLIQRLKMVKGSYSVFLYRLRSSLQAVGKQKEVVEEVVKAGRYDQTKKQAKPHHEHLYELYKSMVVGGHLPVTLEKAIYLSALQLHIETVLQDSGEPLSPVAINSSSTLTKSSKKTLKSRQTLPAIYTKAKNITKRVYSQMAEFEDLSERNAMHRYIEKCQQSPGYNCTFFSVKIPSAGRYMKGSAAKQLMGISNQHVVFLDEKSKDLVCQYNFQDIVKLILDKTDPCIFTLVIRDFSLKVQVENSTTTWEIQNMLEPSRDVDIPNGQDDLDEWDGLDLPSFSIQPPKDTASSPSSAESGDLLQDVASQQAPPPDPNNVTATTLSSSQNTNGHIEGEGLSRENSEDNASISLPSPATFCNCPPDPALPRSMDLHNLRLKDVLKCTEEMARQMTLIDHAQLCRVSALELLQKVNMVPRPQSQRNSKMSGQSSLQSSLSLSSLEQSETAIEKLAFRFNQVGNWVAYCILQHKELDERVTAVHQFILVAKQCLEYNNFSSVMAVVVAGLGSAPIRRLHKTWEGVSKYHIDLFKEMDSLLESGNNYKRYRDRLNTISTPAVPYIGVFLKDLTFICDGNPDYMRGGLINVHKRRQVYSKIEEIKRLQMDTYNFQPVLELQNYFTQYRLTPDDELHALSHELEPKAVVHRRATRSRSSTNLSSTTPNFSFFKPNSKHLSSTTLRT